MKPNPSQQKAIQHCNGPLLILASAGTGKTATLINKIEYLISEKKINPENILAITFTNKAAQEIKGRIEKKLKVAPQISTIHSLCNKILKQELKTAFEIITEDRKKKIVKNVLKKNELKVSAKEFINTMSLIKCGADCEVGRELEELFQVYNKILRKENLFDFDDLIWKAYKLLCEKPAIASKYQYVLVDEFQDIDRSQYELIKMLAKKHKNLCAIGDPDQCIYQFRGSDEMVFEKIKKDFPEFLEIKLEENYRSVGNILDVGNSIITKLENRIPKNLFSNLGKGEKIFVNQFETDRGEAEYVISKVGSLVGETEMYKIDAKALAGTLAEHSFGFSDIAILYRFNYENRLLKESLNSAGIPYQVIGEKSLLDYKIVKDLLTYLEGISQNWGFDRMLDDLSVPKKYFKNKGVFYRDMKTRFTDINLSECIRNVFAHSGLALAHKKEISDDINILKLLNISAKYSDMSAAKSINDFFNETNLLKKDDLYNKDLDAVTLMTLHASKGLEFDVVFIIGCENDLIPMEDSPLDAERRLFFVGITRAKKLLYFSHADIRYIFGEKNQMSVSPFLQDIPSHLIQKKTFLRKPKKERIKDKQMDLF